MKRTKKRPFGLTYNTNIKYIPKLISAYGLCGKALNQEDSLENIELITKAYDYNFLIKKHFKKEVKRLNKVFFELGIFNDDAIHIHAMRSTLFKFPNHYCDKCNALTPYILSPYIVCKKCKYDKISKYICNRIKEDDLYRFINRTRILLAISLKKQGYKKGSKSESILGCEWYFFKQHIERQFKDGMSWSNYGKWHLDHIYPISKATSYEMALELNHYTNFQPLWAFDNISKNNKVVEHQRKLAF